MQNTRKDSAIVIGNSQWQCLILPSQVSVLIAFKFVQSPSGCSSTGGFIIVVWA